MLSPQPVILFYKYVQIAEPRQFAESQRELCARLQLKGRLLIAEEGINGTLAGREDAIREYVATLRRDPRFTDLEVKSSLGDDRTFPKLVVKVRAEIVTLGAGPLAPDLANRLPPAEWKRVLEDEPDAVLVDVRNSYEISAGHFEGAVECGLENFRDLPSRLDRLEAFRDRKVLMYCTGGIRCEKASALFRQRGFKQVFQLHGGIAAYQEEFGNEHWLGELFVFDQRMTVRREQGLKPVSRCAHTGLQDCRFVNCLHDPCHMLFLLSEVAEQADPERVLCPECRGRGLSRETADCKGSPRRRTAAFCPSPSPLPA